MQVRNRWLGTATAAVLMLGCADTPDGPFNPSGPSFAVTDAGPPLALNLYGAGALARAVPRTPCDAAPYREFDFWIGSWDVFDPEDQFAGTNEITRELDGCVIAEHWTGAGGVRGRSISTYDAETGKWHQTWVTANTIGQLRLSGGLVAGEMVMDGVRESVFGFPFFNEITWTALNQDRVRQVAELRIPAIGVASRFTGIYKRVDDVTPIAEAPTTQCAPDGISAETRRLDFLVGDWNVEAENGLHLGRSAIHTDLRGCLFEERFATPKGYRAVAFWYWDRVVGKWYRTYVDSQGERIELAGEFDGTDLVLQGTHGVPGGTVQLRITVGPGAADDVRQTVEISRDGGATWLPHLALRLVN